MTGSKGRTRNARGFTLIEMLISLAIFAVVTGMVVANLRVGRQGDEVRFASQLAASAIRRAQTLAISGERVFMCRQGVNDGHTCLSGQIDECPGGSCARRVPSGYGVRFSTAEEDRMKMLLYADGGEPANRVFDPGETVRSDSIAPSQLVVIDSVSPAGATLDIVFAPPKPTVYVNGGTADVNASVTFRHLHTGQTRTVTINRISGQISAE